MTDEKHDIDPWFIPDEEQVLANEAEREHAEEHGELPDEPLCPHCGKPYKDKDGNIYTHAYIRVKEGGRLEHGSVWKPAVLCSKNHTRSYWNGFEDADPEDIR